ncbi:MAG: hypothetical protein NTX03_12395 [Bacteroidetes bacterium]|nr:hypothetical protein [Bacteroidota bacterium]
MRVVIANMTFVERVGLSFVWLKHLGRFSPTELRKFYGDFNIVGSRVMGSFLILFLLIVVGIVLTLVILYGQWEPLKK